MQKIGLAILVLSLALSSPSTGQDKAFSRDQSILAAAALMDSMMLVSPTPGIDVAIWKDGDLIWSEGYGYADLAHEVPIKAGKTRFRIGSVSKSLTAVALGRLLDAKKVKLFDEVRQHVSYFPLKKYPITLLQLGGHLAGIRHYLGNEFYSGRYYPTIKKGVALFQDDPLLFEPGTQYAYSSYGFNLLSAVIEEASGVPFLEYMEKEVLSPLGMAHTLPDENTQIIPDRTTFYHLVRGQVRHAPYVDNSYKWASGGFLSTTQDLIKMGEAMMAPGFLSKKTWHHLMQTQVTMQGDTTQYGLGWVTTLHKKNKRIGHNGGAVGGASAFWIYPEQKIIIVMLSNSSNTRFGRLPDQLVQCFLP